MSQTGFGKKLNLVQLINKKLIFEVFQEASTVASENQIKFYIQYIHEFFIFILLTR